MVENFHLNRRTLPDTSSPDLSVGSTVTDNYNRFSNYNMDYLIQYY